MSNLVIDIGNTAVKAAWTDGILLGKTYRYQGERFMDFILSLTSENKPDTMVVSSVREITIRNEEILRAECTSLVLMDSRSKRLLQKAGLPDFLTSDRAAAVIAARHLFKGKPVSLFDMGTMLTVDFLSADGAYERGIISPGLMTRFKAVNRYSGKNLPLLLGIPEEINIISSTVEESVYNGVISGTMFEIQGIIASKPENIVIFTGGDANYFAKRLKNSIFVVCNLVLMGLALIAETYE